MKKIKNLILDQDLEVNNSYPNIFIHPFCSKIKKKDSDIILGYHWNDYSKFKKDYIYTQNLEIERFKIDESYKDKLINIISLARDSMYETIPPKLTGSDAIKCEFCYKRKTCFGINDNEEIL